MKLVGVRFEHSQKLSHKVGFLKWSCSSGSNLLVPINGGSLKRQMSNAIEEFNAIMEKLAGLQIRDPVELRRILDETFMGLVNATPLQEIGESIDDIVLFSEGAADITADIHRPVSCKPAPILIYIHGGAWVSGSSKTHRPIGFGFARHGYLVFNINYRLAPEYPFPTPFEDCVAAIRWVAKNAAKYGGDASRIAIGGDSAGGNLSAAAAVALADDGEIKIKALLQIYSAVDYSDINRLYETEPSGTSRLSIETYARGPKELIEKDWRASPFLKAEKFPPTMIVCGKEDNVLYDSKKLARKLSDLGKDHELVLYEEMPHAFLQMELMFPQAHTAIEDMVAFMNRRV